jgi:3-hydroxybutyryl-CoA dehydrogenase
MTTSRVAPAFMIGDLPLVIEYSEVFSAAGISVACSVNQQSGGVKLPASVQRATIPHRNSPFVVELTNNDRERKQKNLILLDRSLPKSTPIVSSSVTVSATEQASQIRFPERLIGLGALPTLLRGSLVEIAPTIHTHHAVIDRTQQLFKQIGKDVSIVQDRVGMVLPRILCMLINEALFAVTERVASASDIDAAMKLGANYPFGPIEWGDTIGFEHVCGVLEALHSDLGEDRYRVAPLLRQLANGGHWWSA